MSDGDPQAEDVDVYVDGDEEYIIFSDGEQLKDNNQDGDNITVLPYEEQTVQRISTEDEGKNVVITEDGQIIYFEEVNEILDNESSQPCLQPQSESENDDVAENRKTPAELYRELEEKRKRLKLPKVPKKFLLYDNICAEIVDYDEDDGAPYVQFSMAVDDGEMDRLPVECGICPDIMHRSKLSEHLKTHIKDGSKRFTCIYCEDNFVTRAYAAGHARRHMGIRPYVCIPCKMYYCTKQDLKVHEQRRHLAREHICELCGKTFAQYTSLKHHRILVHEQRRNYKCDHCGKRFLRKYAMKEHIRSVHYGDRRLLDCPFCNMNFKDTHKLAQHRKEMHLNQSSFTCRVCGLTFNHIFYFDAHRRSLQCREKLKVNFGQQDAQQSAQQSRKGKFTETQHLKQEIIDEEMSQNSFANGIDEDNLSEANHAHKYNLEEN